MCTAIHSASGAISSQSRLIQSRPSSRTGVAMPVGICWTASPRCQQADSAILGDPTMRRLGWNETRSESMRDWPTSARHPQFLGQQAESQRETVKGAHGFLAHRLRGAAGRLRCRSPACGKGPRTKRQLQYRFAAARYARPNHRGCELLLR